MTSAKRSKPRRTDTSTPSPPTQTAKTGAKTSESPIAITLNETQVNQVVNATSGIESISHRLTNLRKSLPLDRDYPPLKDRRLSRSLLLGLLIYAAFPEDGSSLGITELAAQIKASSSTTHRYLTTLLAVGLIERNPDTRRYRLTHTPAK